MSPELLPTPDATPEVAPQNQPEPLPEIVEAEALTAWQTALRFLRRQSPWVLAALVFVALYQVRALLEAHADSDSGAAQAGAHWLSLAGLFSKLLATVLAFAVGLGLAWAALCILTPVLGDWAKSHYATDPTNPATDFKMTFLNLSPAQQMAVFCAVWFGLQGLFAVCWLAASLVQ